MSTFSRAYDQFSQDIALNRQPAVFMVFYGSMFGMNRRDPPRIFRSGALSTSWAHGARPTCREEYLAMIRWACG